MVGDGLDMAQVLGGPSGIRPVNSWSLSLIEPLSLIGRQGVGVAGTGVLVGVLVAVAVEEGVLVRVLLGVFVGVLIGVLVAHCGCANVICEPLARLLVELHSN